MQFLREYAQNIITVSVLAVIFEIILPTKNYKKYISVVIGLIVMMVIISPIKNLLSDFETFAMDTQEFKEEKIDANNSLLVSKEFKRRLEEEIKKEIESQMGKKTDCSVELNVNEKGEIVEIEKVTLSPCDLEIINFVSDKFGIEKEKIGGKKGGGD